MGPARIQGELLGLIAPHAGYVHSGPVAAHAYRELEGREYEVVAVVSPLHRAFAPTAVTTTADAYATPLGEVPVASDLVDALGQMVPLQRILLDSEHSLEIQLPFLQRMLRAFRLLPVMMSDQSLPACQSLGSALARVLTGRKALLVASTDLSHFHRQADAIALDRVALDRIAAYDPLGLSRALERNRTEACGGGPVVAVMLAAQALGANRALVLRHATSADTSGDTRQVVGYAAAALYRGLPADQPTG